MTSLRLVPRLGDQSTLGSSCSSLLAPFSSLLLLTCTSCRRAARPVLYWPELETRVGLQLSDPQQAWPSIWFVLQSLISSWKKEPKLQKQFQTCPHPQQRPLHQPQTLQTGRSQSGLRMHSLPCELSCGLPHPGRSLLTLPVDTGHWPPPSLHTCISMETPLYLCPGHPGQDQRCHLLSGCQQQH